MIILSILLEWSKLLVWDGRKHFKATNIKLFGGVVLLFWKSLQTNSGKKFVSEGWKLLFRLGCQTLLK